MASLEQYYHTLIYLKPIQLYGRAAFRLNRARPRRPTAKLVRRPCGGTWTAPIAKIQSLVAPRTFCFLGHSAEVVVPDHWNHPARDKLWLYNLHYFDDLTACNALERRNWHVDLIDRWIVENVPALGNGWEPYPTSLRIVNWIKFALADAAFPNRWLSNLAAQASYLERRLEWHLLGNHLFANAKALIFAGLFFEGPDATRWLERGLAILERQIPEQVLADGGHFELSPMYHAIILEDLLDLINVGRTFSRIVTTRAVQSWMDVSWRMRRWLHAMTHPDGQITFFNDAAFEIAPEPWALEAYASRLGLPPLGGHSPGILHLPQSGYIRWQGRDAVAFLDVAAIGPDHLPGHAHADHLSFELSVTGERVIVNGGTSTYSSGPQRQRERSTSAHSTVTVDDADSSEVWASFRVARRARIRDLDIAESAGAVRIGASHDGYLRLGGGAVHRREWTFADRKLDIHDKVTGRFQNAVARFHVKPGIRVEASLANERQMRGTLSGNQVMMEWQSASPTQIEPSQWHPAFGRAEQGHCLAVPIAKGKAQTSFYW
jgi:uncharacterized heparinase superfamily protein